MSENYYKSNTHGYMKYENDRLACYLYSLLPTALLSGYSCALEFGAGMGRFSAPLIDNYKQVTLIEPAPEFADVLRNRWATDERVVVLQETAESYLEDRGIGPNQAVFAFHLMHHLDRITRHKIFSAIKASKTKALFVEPNPYNPLILLQVITHPDMRFREEQQYLSLNEKTYKNELAEAGLSILTDKRVLFLPPCLTNNLLQMLPSERLRLFEKLNRYLPCFSSYQVIVCG
jgi:hypothetical protein